MPQFDIYPSDTGFSLDIQTDLLAGFNTRIVVPLMPPGVAPPPERRLNPTFEIDGKPFVMVTQYMAAVQARTLADQSATSTSTAIGSEVPSTGSSSFSNPAPPAR